MKITRIVMNVVHPSVNQGVFMETSPDPSLQSGYDEGGVWYYAHAEDDETMRIIVPWTSILWIEER